MERSAVSEDRVISNVVQIFKKDEKCKVENYSPVSLASQLSKLLESIIKDEIMSHLKKHNREQFTAQVDKGHPVDVIYMDFTKAFDKAPHRRLHEKLKAHGTRPKLIKRIDAWLCNRKQ